MIRLALLALLACSCALTDARAADAASERLVFSVESRAGADLELVSLDIRTGDLRQLLDSRDYDEWEARASVDGTRIIFTRTRVECRSRTYTARCPGDLWTMRADGSGLARVTDTPALDEIIGALSPDGRRVAFNASAHGSDRWGIYVADIDGGNVVRLTDRGDEAWTPDWSPDGKQLAFLRWPAGSSVGAIWVTDADGSHARQVSHPPPWTTRAPPSEDISPSWSPDGRRIAFSRLGADGSYDLYVVNADGTGERQLTNDIQYTTFSSAWSPDGSRIATGRYPWNYYTQVAPGDPDFYGRLPDAGIYIMNADGSAPRHVHPPVWSDPTWTVVGPGSAPLATLTPVAPAAAPAPEPGAVAILPGRLTISRTRAALVRLRCQPSPCRGRLELWAGTRKLGSTAYLVHPGPPRRVGIRVSAYGHRLARRRGGVRVRVVAVAVDGRSVARRAVLRAARR